MRNLKASWVLSLARRFGSLVCVCVCVCVPGLVGSLVLCFGCIVRVVGLRWCLFSSVRWCIRLLGFLCNRRKRRFFFLLSLSFLMLVWSPLRPLPLRVVGALALGEFYSPALALAFAA